MCVCNSEGTMTTPFGKGTHVFGDDLLGPGGRRNIAAVVKGLTWRRRGWDCLRVVLRARRLPAADRDKLRSCRIIAHLPEL